MNMQKKRKRNTLDHTTKIYSILGIITMIYISTYIMVRATQEEEIKITSAYNPKESQKETQINLQPSKPQTMARIKIRKKSNIPADPSLKAARITSNSNLKEKKTNTSKIKPTKASSYYPNEEDRAIPQPGKCSEEEVNPKGEEVNVILLSNSEIEGTFSSLTPDIYKKISNIEQNQSHEKNENSDGDVNNTELSNTKLHTNPSPSPSSPFRDQQAESSDHLNEEGRAILQLGKYSEKEVKIKEEEVNLILSNISEIGDMFLSSTPNFYKKNK